MKHRQSNRILGRVASSRKRLLQSLSEALLAHGSIVTTEAKAKELRRFFEPLVTRAKKEMTLHNRRQLLQVLSLKSLGELQEVAKEQKTRPGGYLRITRVPTRRQDAARMMKVDIIK